jgi:hypothetical protein
MLKSAGVGNVVSRADIAKTLGVNEGSVPVYFFVLKNKFKVKFAVEKKGRTVIGYKLLADDVDVRENCLPRGRKVSAAAKVAKTTVAKVKPPKTAKPAKATEPEAITVVTRASKEVKKAKEVKQKLAPVAMEDLEIDEITSNDLEDIKSQLGLA